MENKTFYLDTSAINRLYDDPEGQNLRKVLQENSIVYPSIFTVAELSAEPDESRRIGLLALIKKISGNYRPVAMPGDLLRRSLKSVSIWSRDMNHSMGTKWGGVWLALNDPTLIDENAYKEIIEWKREQESWYQDMHDRGRPAMQEVIKKMPSCERDAIYSRFSKLISYYLPEGDFLENMVFDLASSSGENLAITDELVQRVIKHSEHWRFFLAGMAYGLYVRSVKVTNFSKKKNPGSIDTQQAIYLTLCNVFVTADKAQYKMLRLLAPFGHKKRYIWQYPKFAQYLNRIALKVANHCFHNNALNDGRV